MVPMRDGVRLSADIYLPARDGEALPGKHPALLHRTQYDKSIIERSIGWCTWFAERGYVAIIQDSRGTFESEGITNFFIPEAEDGFDTLEWIGQQPWSNGEVGNWGISWAAWTQTAMAALGPPNMGPLVPTFGGSNAYTSTVRQGGAFELRLMGAAFWVSAFNKNPGLKQESFIDSALNRSPTRLTDWLTRLPIRRGQTQLALVPNYENWVFEIMTRSDYDEYWKHPSFAPAEYWDDFPDKPMLFVGGWYDPYTRAVFENFTGLSALKKGPVRVLVGPWTHANDSPERVYAGDAEFGADAAIDFKETHLRWFDQWMRGVDNGVREEAAIRLFVMGGGGGHRTLDGRIMHGGRWRDEHEWPLARTKFTPFYIHSDGSLDAAAPSEPESSTTYTFDPDDPVPTIGGQLSAFYELTDLPPGIADPSVLPRPLRAREIVAAGGYDQVEDPRFFGCSPPYLPLGSRRDVLVYQTDPLEEDVEVTGPIEVVLWVSSDAPRHRLHREAHRLLPAQHSLPIWLQPEPDRQHHPAALPSRRREGRPPACRRGGARKDHPAAHQQPLRRRPPDTPRHLQFQLPALRREPEYRRTAPATPPQVPGRQHRLPRRRAPLAHPPAHHPAVIDP